MEKLIPMIRIYIVDYIIALRKQLRSGDEFLRIRQAARKVDVSVSTLYMWIEKGIINPIIIENKKYVSTTECRFARDHIYQPVKARKKAGGTRKSSIDSRPISVYGVKMDCQIFPTFKVMMIQPRLIEKRRLIPKT